MLKTLAMVQWVVLISYCTVQGESPRTWSQSTNARAHTTFRMANDRSRSRHAVHKCQKPRPPNARKYSCLDAHWSWLGSVDGRLHGGESMLLRHCNVCYAYLLCPADGTKSGKEQTRPSDGCLVCRLAQVSASVDRFLCLCP